jgi:hypothetical protein
VAVASTAWATCSTDLTEHAVAESDLRPARFVIDALCSRTVVVAPLASSPVRRCPACLAFLRARATLRGLAGAPQPRRRLGRWFFGRCRGAD